MSESRFEPGVFHLQYSLSQRAQSEIEFVPTVTTHLHRPTKCLVRIENSFTVITIRGKSKHTSRAATCWLLGLYWTEYYIICLIL